uniref:Uncharacterized protein n=1 Tax=Meloidogyne enterolobii TaxID=390850 RepID=A0A6V7X881_MELEN|nr:unnamed protein product [Meloidogyne enterolobii]
MWAGIIFKVNLFTLDWKLILLFLSQKCLQLLPLDDFNVHKVFTAILDILPCQHGTN